MKARGLETALKTFREKGGTLRTRDLVALGVHTDALYALRGGGQVVQLGVDQWHEALRGRARNLQ